MIKAHQIFNCEIFKAYKKNIHQVFSLFLWNYSRNKWPDNGTVIELKVFLNV